MYFSHSLQFTIISLICSDLFYKNLVFFYKNAAFLAKPFFIILPKALLALYVLINFVSVVNNKQDGITLIENRHIMVQELTVGKILKNDDYE